MSSYTITGGEKLHNANKEVLLQIQTSYDKWVKDRDSDAAETVRDLLTNKVGFNQYELAIFPCFRKHVFGSLVQ